MKLTDIPSLTVRPAGAAPSRMGELLQSRAVGRRGIMKGVAGAAMVLGIGALDLIPGQNNAYASRKGRRPWEYWSRCRDYNSWPSDWKWCNPDSARVSGSYCQARHRNRHRTDVVDRDGCHWTNYNKAMRCIGDNGAKINAWRWHRSEGPNTGPRSVSCSDGRVYYQVHPSCRTRTYKSTCRHYL